MGKGKSPRGDKIRVRVQVPIDEFTRDRIDVLAERMGLSRGAMAGRLLELGLEDNEFIIRLFTTKLLNPLRELYEGSSAKDAKKKGGKKNK